MTTQPESPRLALHQLALYNTGRMTTEQVVAAFAARRELFERIVAELAAEKPKSRAQHHLIVGQRGMGKTMLLARIAAELRSDANLAARFIPLAFAEEQYAVDRLSKFWLNCLDSLADARELAHDTQGVEDIDTTVARLTALEGRGVGDDQPFADEVYEAFVAAARAGGQRPVLLVDNLQLVFERLPEAQQHSLRELLMRSGSPILVGASPSPPPQTQSYGAAFYDHFKVHYLRPLDESEMRDLLLHLASAVGRDDVRERVLQHPSRLKILRQLTGGNPRTTLTLFFLYAEDFTPSVFGDLEGLLDRVTPLYKARFEELTPQQQVVASAVASHWDPVTASELASSTLLPAGTISAQIDRLEKVGVVERVDLFVPDRPSATRTGYQIAERFFNIWFLMRSSSRRQRREVEYLTRFLESFYEPTERSRLAHHLMSENQFSPDRFMWSQAVAASLTEPATAEELNRHTELVALREEAREARARLHDLIDFEKLQPATLAFDELRKRLRLLVQPGSSISPDQFAEMVLGDRRMFLSGERERLAAHVGKLNAAELDGVVKPIPILRVFDTWQFSPEAVEWFSARLATGQIRSVNDADDWNRAFLQARGVPIVRLMVDTLPRFAGSMINETSFQRICMNLTPTSTASALEWFQWGFLLHAKLGRAAAAEAAYLQSIDKNPTAAMPWYYLGSLYQDNPVKYSASEVAYRRAIELDPQFAWPWNGLGILFFTKLGRVAEAEVALRKAIDLDPQSSSAWDSLGNLYWDGFDRLAEAADAFESALRLDPLFESSHQNRLFLRRDFLGEGASARPLLTQLLALSRSTWEDSTHLQEALFDAYDSNWGLLRESLGKALAFRTGGFEPSNIDDWLRATAVLLHLDYGAQLLALLDERGDTERLRPWVEAVRAHQIGDRRALQNVAPETRTTAEIFYDGIEKRLKRLPESTRRRPVAEPKPKRKERR